MYMFLPCDLGIHVYIQDINIYIKYTYKTELYYVFVCV